MPTSCNFERLKEISMGDDEFAAELVRVFLDDAVLQIDTLGAAVEQADWRAALDAAHRLKGAAGNVGAEILADACRRIESAARNELVSGLAAEIHEARRELARVRVAVQQEMGLA